MRRLGRWCQVISDPVYWNSDVQTVRLFMQVAGGSCSLCLSSLGSSCQLYKGEQEPIIPGHTHPPFIISRWLTQKRLIQEFWWAGEIINTQWNIAHIIKVIQSRLPFPLPFDLSWQMCWWRILNADMPVNYGRHLKFESVAGTSGI